MANLGRTAALIGSGLLVGAGKGILEMAQAKREESLARLKMQHDKDERQLDRDHQDRQNQEKAFGDFSNTVLQVKSQERREEGETQRHKELLKSNTDRAAAEQAGATDRAKLGALNLIEEADGTLSLVNSDGTSIKVTRDGAAVKGKKVGTPPKPDEGGMSAADERLFKSVATARGLLDPLGNVEDPAAHAAALRETPEGAKVALKIYGPEKAPTPPPPIPGTAAAATPSPAADAPPAAPRDVAQREVGKTYTAHDGRHVKWTGQGWELVQ